MNDAIRLMRDGLDEMCQTSLGAESDPEWAKVNALRFVENYRIMRALEAMLEEEK